MLYVKADYCIVISEVIVLDYNIKKIYKFLFSDVHGNDGLAIDENNTIVSCKWKLNAGILNSALALFIYIN